MYGTPIGSGLRWIFGDLIVLFMVLFLLRAVSWLSLKSGEKDPKKILDLAGACVVFLVGALLAIACHDFIQFCAGLIIQALGTYGLLFLVSDRKLKAVKVYGGVMVCAGSFMIVGILFLYSTTQSFSFYEIAAYMTRDVHFGFGSDEGVIPIYFIVGSFFLLVSLMIPIGIFPFSLWVRSFYDDLNTHVFLFIILSIPVLFLFLLVKVLWGPFISYMVISQNGLCLWAERFFTILGAITVFWGTLGAFRENRINAFMAYNSLAFSGYALMGFSLGSYGGVNAVFLFVILFTLTMLGLYSVLQGVSVVFGRGVYTIKDFKELGGIHVQNPYLSMGISVMILSLACVPPLSGFWSRFNLMVAFVENGQWLWSVFIGIMGGLTVASYLRIVRYMYRDKVVSGHRITLNSSTIVFMVLAIGSGIAYNAYSEVYMEKIYLLTDGLLKGPGVCARDY